MLAVQPQFEMREKARVVVKQAVGIAHRGADVAVAVRDDEGIAALERAARPRRGAGRRNVERGLTGQIDTFLFLLHKAFERHGDPRERKFPRWQRDG